MGTYRALLITPCNMSDFLATVHSLRPEYFDLLTRFEFSFVFFSPKWTYTSSFTSEEKIKQITGIGLALEPFEKKYSTSYKYPHIQ